MLPLKATIVNSFYIIYSALKYDSPLEQSTKNPTLLPLYSLLKYVSLNFVISIVSFVINILNSKFNFDTDNLYASSLALSSLHNY